MADKPSYLRMLNGIANGERQGYEYLNAWYERATDPDVKRTLRIVKNREHEHSLAFAKRIDELGFELEPGDVLDFSKHTRSSRRTAATTRRRRHSGSSSARPTPMSATFSRGYSTTRRSTSRPGHCSAATSPRSATRDA
jgi:Mn-containing catalase